MKKVTNRDLGELGTVKLENVCVSTGRIEVHLPLENIGKEADEIIERSMEWYKKNYPEVNTEQDVNWDFRLVFNFGCLNPEFEAMVIIWQKSDEETGNDTAEIYDDFPVELSAKDTKNIKKIIWDKLGETLFNL